MALCGLQLLALLACCPWLSITVCVSVLPPEMNWQPAQATKGNLSCFKRLNIVKADSVAVSFHW